MTKVPPRPTSDKLAAYWDRPVSDLVQCDLPEIDPAEKERHHIFCLLLMALIHDNWNGNIWGPDGEYPWRLEQRDTAGRYRGGSYLGHNIVAIAVTKEGDVIDFDFNHNDLFQSSIEHAESRLVRRLFNLTEVRRAWIPRPASTSSAPRRSDDYTGLLADVTIYTSLESCAQCAGIMTLSSAKSVVFLQADPGQYSIGNVLYNLAPPRTGSRYHAPLPIPGDVVGSSYFNDLAAAYAEFRQGIKARPFYRPANGGPDDHSAAISSFLCTDLAFEIYQRGASELANYAPTHAGNEAVLTAAKSFRDYARDHGCRGTPH